MPAHGRYGETRGVRWDEDLAEFVMKCEDCAAQKKQCYWPITTEFWNPRTMQRCRACDKEQRSRTERKRYQRDRVQRLATNKQYYQENWELIRWKDNQRKAARRAAATQSASGAPA